jgi:formamidopyrimidine-DNA glycosylase
MPELPEVETIRRQISKAMPATILACKTSPLAESIIQQNQFSPVGAVIENISRHGKVLYFELDRDRFFISHLGMSGGWRLAQKPSEEKHTHLELTLTNRRGNQFLSYIDPRRFGELYWVYRSQYEEHQARLGVDIGGTEFTELYLANLIQRFPFRQLKVFLLDQKYFAGCGNYLANEICARAGVRPTRRCKAITQREVSRLVAATRDILAGAISAGGLSFDGGYRDTRGNKGRARKGLVVFHQEVCGICRNSKIKRIVLGGRGTYYCRNCQK